MNILFSQILIFFSLAILQGLVFNHINFLGGINPYPYVLFIILFPIKITDETVLIISGFLIGLVVDMFLDTGGIHAGASVFLAYMRALVLRFFFKANYEYHDIKIKALDVRSKLHYIMILIIIHHLVLFCLQIFNLSEIGLILKHTLYSGVFTTLISIIIVILFYRVY